MLDWRGKRNLWKGGWKVELILLARGEAELMRLQFSSASLEADLDPCEFSF